MVWLLGDVFSLCSHLQQSEELPDASPGAADLRVPQPGAKIAGHTQPGGGTAAAAGPGNVQGHSLSSSCSRGSLQAPWSSQVVLCARA